MRLSILTLLLALLLAPDAVAQDARIDGRALIERGAKSSLDAETQALAVPSFGAISAPFARGGAMALLTETFDATFTGGPPAAPPGWVQIRSVQTTSATPDWTRYTAGTGNCTVANPCVRSIDADIGASERFLITSQVTPTAAENSLTFRASQFYGAEYGSVLTVRVSTTDTAPASFTTIATFNEADLPSGGASALAPQAVSLAAYNGQAIYIAFVHTQSYGDQFYLDDVEVGAPVATSFTSTTAQFQNTSTEFQQTTEQWVLGANVVIGGSGGTVPVTSMTFTTTGTTNTADLANARLLYSGASTSFNYATTPEFGTGIANPNGTMTFTGTQALPAGNNYFILVYEAAAGAGIGNLADATYTSATVGGTARTPTATTLTGALTISAAPPPPPSNDDLANARVVTSGAYTDSQTNQSATSETGEAAAACALGDDGTESIWYSYTPGASGTATISAGGFDTVLALYTGSSFPLTEVDCVDDTTGVETITASVTAETEYFIRVTGYGGTIGTVAFSLNGPAPSGIGPIFALTPETTQNLGTVGACTGTPSQSTTFTVSNDGGGSLSVSDATLTGDAGFTVDTSGLPATLASGEDVDLEVTFTPTLGQTGSASTQFTVDYNDGAAQTSTAVTVEATATDASANGGSGGGIAFANDAGGACAASGIPPTANTLIDLSTHTRITDWDDDGASGGDDSRFELTETVLDGLGFGGMRLFGETGPSVHINSNATVSLTSTTATNLTLPTTTGGGLIAVGNMDLDLDATFAADNTGEFGEPDVFYGASDVDMDGETDLIVTWWHAYDFGGSAAYPDPAGEFITMQLIVFGGPANEDSRFEIRFPDGVDANGVPYQQNVNTVSMRDDLAIGISNSTGTASSEYRENPVGGAVSDGDGVAVRFTPETQATVASGAGWRMLSAPVTGYTVGRLAELNLVQGAGDQYPDADGVLFDGYDGTAYTVPASDADVLAPGEAFFWYLFDNDLDPDEAGQGGGTSNSYALPMALQGTGAETTADPVSVTLNTIGDATSLVGNPFRSSLDLTGLGTWATGGTLASSVGQIWDGTGYTMTSDPSVNDVISAWQGMFVENTDAASLDIPASAKTTGGTLVEKSGAPRVAFHLAGTATDGTPTLDRSLIVELSADATDGWDLRDASKLRPLLGAYATAAFQGERDGEARLKAQESRSLTSEGFEVPMVIDAVGVEDELTLTWPTFEIADGTPVVLRDLVTGTVIDLRSQDSYTFTVAPEAAREGAPADLLTQSSDGATAKSGEAPRFVLAFGSAIVANEGDAVTEFALESARPNPTRGTASVRFALPEAGDVEVTLYDLLGRRVAVLAQGEHGAGWHTASLDASALSAGVYVLRMTTEGFAETQRVTVIR